MLFDVSALSLQTVALNFINSSVYQMMRGGTIATTFFFSVILLKMKPKRYQIVGSLLTFIGILIVGLSNLIFGAKNENNYSIVIFLYNIVIIDNRIFINYCIIIYGWILFYILIESI